MYPRINESYFFRGLLAFPMRSDFSVELGVTGVILRSVGRALIKLQWLACAEIYNSRINDGISIPKDIKQ